MIVGFVCRPKKESRIDVVPDPTALAVTGGLDGLTPLLSLFVPETELLTAAKTTLANEIPEVEPRYLESDAPCTDTLPIFETSLLSLSDSSCFLFQAASFGEGLCESSVEPLYGGGSSEAGVWTVVGSAPGLEPWSRTSAGAKEILFSWRTFSR